MYRSIHYTIRAIKDNVMVHIEIQTRSIFEEGWSEINHKLLYKKNSLSLDEEVLLKQTSSILSSLAGDCDTLGELMMRIVNKEEDVDFVRDCNSVNGNLVLEELMKVEKDK